MVAEVVGANGLVPKLLEPPAWELIFHPTIGDGAAETVNVCVASIAGLKFALPDWLAVIVVVPAPKMVTVFPSIVATVAFELVYTIAKPELAFWVKE